MSLIKPRRPIWPLALKLSSVSCRVVSFHFHFKLKQTVLYWALCTSANIFVCVYVCECAIRYANMPTKWVFEWKRADIFYIEISVQWLAPLIKYMHELSVCMVWIALFFCSNTVCVCSAVYFDGSFCKINVMTLFAYYFTTGNWSWWSFPLKYVDLASIVTIWKLNCFHGLNHVISNTFSTKTRRQII